MFRLTLRKLVVLILGLSPTGAALAEAKDKMSLDFETEGQITIDFDSEISKQEKQIKAILISIRSEGLNQNRQQKRETRDALKVTLIKRE